MDAELRVRPKGTFINYVMQIGGRGVSKFETLAHKTMGIGA